MSNENGGVQLVGEMLVYGYWLICWIASTLIFRCLPVLSWMLDMC